MKLIPLLIFTLSIGSTSLADHEEGVEVPDQSHRATAPEKPNLNTPSVVYLSFGRLGPNRDGKNTDPATGSERCRNAWKTKQIFDSPLRPNLLNACSEDLS